LDSIFAADADRTVLGAQPTGPIASFELLEFVALGARIEQDKIRNRIIQMAKLLREHRTKGRPDKRRTRRRSASEQVDPLQVLALGGLHRTDHCQLIGDARALWHQLAKMHSGQLGGNTAEGPASRTARFGVPSLKL